jgi:FHS family L-fucose permease-like MFS transporter
MAVPLGFFLVPLTYAFCVNFVPAYRDVVDRTFDSKVGLQPTLTKDEESGSGEETGVGEDKGAAVHSETRGEEISQMPKV